MHKMLTKNNARTLTASNMQYIGNNWLKSTSHRCDYSSGSWRAFIHGLVMAHQKMWIQCQDALNFNLLDSNSQSCS